MSSVEAALYHRPWQAREKDISRVPLAVVFDDEEDFRVMFGHAFEKSEVAVLTPGGPNRERSSFAYSEILQAFIDDLSFEQLGRIQAVVIDQFWDDTHVHLIAFNFLDKLRSVNKQAWVVEVSGSEEGRIIHRESNAFIHKLDIGDFANCVRRSGDQSGVQLTAFKFFSTLEYIEAARVDPAHVSGDELITNTEDSGRRLFYHELYPRVLEKLGINENHFLELYGNFSVNTQALIHHHLWNIIGLAKANVDDFENSLSAQRLREVLQTKKA